jgi:hypothetical protein
MNEKLSILVFLLLFVACSSNNEKAVDNKDFMSDTLYLKTDTLYPDSLTQIQKKCVEKVYAFKHAEKYKDLGFPAYDVKGYLTSEETDAIVELSCWDLKEIYKPVDGSAFLRRFREVFGYDFESFSKFLGWNSGQGWDDNKGLGFIQGRKYNDNLITFVPTNPCRQFFISKKDRVIVDCSNFDVYFEKSDIIFFRPLTRASIPLNIGYSFKKIIVSRVGYLYHLNSYLFNEDVDSRKWLLENDKYFMSHLLMEYGYDGDEAINKMVLKEIMGNKENAEVYDKPISVFKVYPDGNMRVLDGLLKTAAEMSTPKCADYFKWAISEVSAFNADKEETES